jgi:uncharacterized membrane protein YccC
VKPSAWTTFWQSVVRFEGNKMTPWLALRNTAGVALPLIAAAALGSLSGGLAMSTGALNVSFSDSHDPYIQRARKMIAASILVGFAVFAGALYGRSHIIAIILSAAWAVAAGMMVAVSTAAADLGVISLVTLVVYSGSPQTAERALFAGLLAFAGGLFQTLLALASWPLRRYVHQRRALGDLYAELARAAATPVQAMAAPPASAQSTQAQNTLATMIRDHSVEGERYRFLLSQAERTRLSLLLLGRLRARMEREAPASSEGAILSRYLEICSRVLSSIGDSLLPGEPLRAAPEDLSELHALADELREPTKAQPAEIIAPPQISVWKKDARSQMDALTGQIRSAIDLAASATPAGLQAFERREAGMPWTLRFTGTLATLRANLHLRSPAFRHAIRLAVCVGLGDALARGAGLQRSYWLPMTIAIVLKPDFTATFSRGVLRLSGTFAGLLLATVLFHWLHPAVFVEIALIAALMFALRWVGPANYGIFVIAVTALVVLLLAIAGVTPNAVMGARALNTVLGGAIALLAYWLWPTWERTQISETTAQMLDAYRLYFRSIRLIYEGQNDVEPKTEAAAELDRVRLKARLSRSNLEASIDRLSAEPGAVAAQVSLLGAVLASSHRLVHAIMALEAGLSSSRPVPARAAFRSFANDVELTLYYLASALRGSPIERTALPDLREGHHALVHSGDSLTERYALVNVETDRITNSLNTLSEDLLRWTGSRST